MGMGSDGGGVDAGAGDGVPYAPVIDTSVAHPARIYDYWLGGKDNFAADREAGEQVARGLSRGVPRRRANRAFLGRAVRYLAGEAGIRQFLDIGTGMPTGRQHPRGGPAGRPGRPDRLRRQRPDRARPRPGAADQHPARAPPPTSTPTCATRTRSWPRPRRRWTSASRSALMLLAVLQLHPGRRGPVRAGGPADGRAAVRAATWSLAPDRRLRPRGGAAACRRYNERGAGQATLRTTAEIAAVLRRPGTGRARGGPGGQVAAGRRPDRQPPVVHVVAVGRKP